MEEDRQKEQQARILMALGSADRLNIVHKLMSDQRPIHIKGIAKEMGLDYASVYRNVKLLASAKIIDVFEVGRSRVIKLRDPEGTGILLKHCKSLSDKINNQKG